MHNCILIIKSIYRPTLLPLRTLQNNLKDSIYLNWASQVVLVVKNLPINTGDIRDTSSFPGLGRSPGGGPRNPP